MKKRISTSTKIFHNAFIKFIRGRLSFSSKNSKKNGKGMHDSMLVLGEHERLKNYEWDKKEWKKLV
jgi:hypothetical protein